MIFYPPGVADGPTGRVDKYCEIKTIQYEKFSALIDLCAPHGVGDGAEEVEIHGYLESWKGWSDD